MSTPLRTQSDIRIDSRDRWWFKDELMINEAILTYFKKNLRRDTDGSYFIINTWGERTEHSYIQGVAGFPVAVTQIYTEEDPPRARLDSDETLEFDPADLRVFDDETIGLILRERDVPARLTGGAMAALGPLMDMEGDSVFLTLNGIRLQLAPGDRSRVFAADEATGK